MRPRTTPTARRSRVEAGRPGRVLVKPPASTAAPHERRPAARAVGAPARAVPPGPRRRCGAPPAARAASNASWSCSMPRSTSASSAGASASAAPAGARCSRGRARMCERVADLGDRLPGRRRSGAVRRRRSDARPPPAPRRCGRWPRPGGRAGFDERLQRRVSAMWSAVLASRLARSWARLSRARGRARRGAAARQPPPAAPARREPDRAPAAWRDRGSARTGGPLPPARARRAR